MTGRRYVWPSTCGQHGKWWAQLRGWEWRLDREMREQALETCRMYSGDVHGWWREKRSLTVVMYRKVEMYGWRDLEKVEIDVEGFRLVEGIKSGRGT